MKKVLITGGSGTVGEAFIREFYNTYKFFSFSRNEKMQVALKRNFPEVEILLGSVEDGASLQYHVRKIKPDIVIHAAALKHVDSAEKSPIAAVKSNILGSLNVIETSVTERVPSVVAISTDKACQPDNNYGQTKALMEKMFLEAHTQDTKFNVCRFGNVSHSHGSVIPYWLRLRDAGSPLPLTHVDMNRLIISRAGAARLIGEVICRAETDDEAFVLTRKMKSVNMHHLAKTISNNIEVVGLRPGEKLNETLVASSELARTFCDEDYILIREFENPQRNVLEAEYSSKNAEFMNENQIQDLVDDTFDDMSKSLLSSKIY